MSSLYSFSRKEIRLHLLEECERIYGLCCKISQGVDFTCTSCQLPWTKLLGRHADGELGVDRSMLDRSMLEPRGSRDGDWEAVTDSATGCQDRAFPTLPKIKLHLYFLPI